MKRVVITGSGVVSPFGVGTEILWDSLLKNRNGISKISDPNIRGEIVKIAGNLPKVDFSKYKALAPQLDKYIPEDENVKIFFLAVAEAIKESGLDFGSAQTDNVGVFIADRSMGPAVYMEQYVEHLRGWGLGEDFDRNRFFKSLQQTPIKMIPGAKDHDSINHYVSRALNITGPQLSIGTACASANNAFGEAWQKIRTGRLEKVICGGAFAFEITGMMGFTRLGALTTSNDPETACRPFDLHRSGFVMGSGCGILILEELEVAKKRGAHILAEVSGCSSLADGYRATDPDPTASGATRTIANCLQLAKVNPRDVSYINAHGTSTKMNDMSETKAVKNVFGTDAYNIPISSTKSMIGHGIMAAGAMEAIACIRSIKDNVIHQTRNWTERDPELDLDYVPEGPRQMNVKHVLSNNFGFGGQNASVLFSKYEG